MISSIRASLLIVCVPFRDLQKRANVSIRTNRASRAENLNVSESKMLAHVAIVGEALVNIICFVGLIMAITVTSLWISSCYIMYTWMTHHILQTARQTEEKKHFNNILKKNPGVM